MMVMGTNLVTYYRDIYRMVKYLGFSITDIEYMIPYELVIYTDIALADMKKEK